MAVMVTSSVSGAASATLRSRASSLSRPHGRDPSNFGGFAANADCGGEAEIDILRLASELGA
jgi:hypothetical protein